MPTSFRIDVEGDESGIDQAVDRAYDKLDRLEQKASGIRLGGAPGRNVGTSSGSGGLLSDPWAALESAKTDLWAAGQLGASGSMLDPYRLSVARAQSSVDRADRMINASTPGGLGGGSVLARLGSSGLSLRAFVGGIGGDAAGLAALAYAGYQFAGAGLSNAYDLGSASYIGGGSAAETAGVSGVGRFLGRTAAQSAGAAVAFGSSLHSPTFGAGYFRSQGIVDFGGLTTDKDINYLKAVRALGNERDPNLAIRVARDTGLTDELWLRDLSPDERSGVLRGMSDFQSPAERAAVAEQRKVFAQASSALALGERRLFQAGLVTFGWMFGMSHKELQRANAYDPDEYVQPAFNGDWAGMLPGENPYEFMARKNKGRTFAGQSVRVSSGMVGGGPRAQAALPPLARGVQLGNNLEGYGQYVGGYVGG